MPTSSMLTTPRQQCRHHPPEDGHTPLSQAGRCRHRTSVPEGAGTGATAVGGAAQWSSLPEAWADAAQRSVGRAPESCLQPSHGSQVFVTRVSVREHGAWQPRPSDVAPATSTGGCRRRGAGKVMTFPGHPCLGPWSTYSCALRNALGAQAPQKPTAPNLAHWKQPGEGNPVNSRAQEGAQPGPMTLRF